jgi:class 3 adenylate cyclase
MAAFFSAASATRCGIRIQQDLAQHRASRPDLPLQVRIGIAAGEPIEHHNDFFGTTVQLAARLCAHAEPGHILISNTVAELCAGKALHLHSEGLMALKGFDEPLQVHRVEITSA